MLRRESPHGCRPGFSLFELILVMFLIGLLSLMVVPSLRQILPSSKLNSDSRRLAGFMRQARLRAANTQKPVRVSLNCMRHFNPPVGESSEPCRALMEMAVYEDGKLDEWRVVREGRLEFDRGLNIKAGSAAWSAIAGSAINADLIWLVFAPSSRIITSFGPPVNITMWYGDRPYGGETFDMTLNQASGRVSMSRGSH